ncbi:MAG: hypothetical protein IJT97_09215 [Bacteroidaceae bacterium]|nr:hypothetical protein [Bacteroidaceae bacterium]
MQRTFQAHISFKHYALLAALLLAVVCLYWMPLQQTVTGCLLGFLLTLMVIVVSKAINTCYIIHSEGFLEIRKGRFSKNIRISINDIDRIDKIRNGALVIVLKNDLEYFITPQNELDFIRCIEKYHS